MCQKSTGIVWYRSPPPEEKNNTQTTKRRRAMMSELVVHMSPEQLEAIAAKRQADIRFIQKEQDIEQQCSETSGLAKVVTNHQNQMSWQMVQTQGGRHCAED